MDREVVDLYLDDIIPNRFQPREVFNEDALMELSNSIKEHGIIQPIIVRKIGDKYEIIAGERRYKASVLAGLTKIPAIIRNLDDKESSKVALLENLQRKDLTPIEEARTYQKILELDSMTQEELGRSMGKSQAAIANKMRLLSLPDEIQEALLQNKISERHARSLLNLDTSEEQIDMLHSIIEKRLTVRELDDEIKKIKGDFNKDEEPEIISIPEPINDMPFIFDLETTDKEPITIPDEIDNIVSTPIINNFNEIKEEEPQEVKKPEEKPYINIEDLLNDDELYSLKDAVQDIKHDLKKVEEKGFSIKMEEMDFESTYQIIIKIEKK